MKAWKFIVLAVIVSLTSLATAPRQAQAGIGKYLVAGLVAKAVRKSGTKVGAFALKRLVKMAAKSPKVKYKILQITNTYVGHNDTMDAAANFVMVSVEKGKIDQVAWKMFVETAKEDAAEELAEQATSGVIGKWAGSKTVKKMYDIAVTAKDYWQYLNSGHPDPYGFN